VVFVTLLPTGDQLGAVQDILIESPGQVRGKLQPPEIPGGPVEIVFEDGELRLIEMGREQLHEPPGGKLRVEKRRFGRVGQNPLKDLLQEGIGKGEAAVGANAEVRRQLHRKPPLHPFALNDDDFRFQRRGQRPFQDSCQELGEQLQPVARIELERLHGFVPRGCGQC